MRLVDSAAECPIFFHVKAIFLSLGRLKMKVISNVQKFYYTALEKCHPAIKRNSTSSDARMSQIKTSGSLPSQCSKNSSITTTRKGPATTD